MRIIVALTSAKAIHEILIVFITGYRCFGVNAALSIGLGIDSKCTWRSFWQTRSAAVANKVTLVEQLDELMFTMALNRAGITDTGRSVWF